MKPTQDRKIYLSPPHIMGDELDFILEALKTNWVSTVGSNIDYFEEEIASLLGVPDAVALSSGTAAIHLALMLLGVDRGDEVFCSSFTFVASCNPIRYQGADPVFIDSDEETWCMSPETLREALKDRAKRGRLPKAVIVADIYGQVAKMDKIRDICTEYEVALIEDAAEALGSSYRGQAAGSFGDFGILSFNGNKIITTSGGGMLLCPTKEMGAKARFLASQAKDNLPYYHHSEIGYNYRISNLLAGLGRSQLRHLKRKVELRRAVFQRYYDHLKDIPGFYFMSEGKESQSNRWLSVLMVEEQVAGCSVWDLYEHLKQKGIETRPVWKPLHQQPIFKDYDYYPLEQERSFSDYLFQHGLCLPSGSNLSLADQEYVIESIKEFITVRLG